MPGLGPAARVFRDFRYRTRDSWCRKRRVVGKAEHTPDGANPRFVVTSLKHARMADPRALYEDLYCARGEAENRIGEQFELFADRASSATMMANQLRMWFSAIAYVLVDTLRRVGRECQPLAAVFGLGQRLVRRYFDHRQGSRVSIWRIGWSAMRLRTSAR